MYTGQYRHNYPSMSKRTYGNSYISSSKPISHSIRKDAKYPETIIQKNIYNNSPMLSYTNQSTSKAMISSIKEGNIATYSKY